MQPVLRQHTSKPVYPEDLEEGLDRYSRAMQVIGTHGLLLVSCPPSVSLSLSHMLYLIVNTAHAWLPCPLSPTMLTISCFIAVLSYGLLCFDVIIILQEIAHSFAGHTVLVVTHGEVGALGSVSCCSNYTHVGCTVWWQLDTSHACLPSFLLPFVALQCVRQAVLMGEPSSEVFEVRHTGYVVLKHAPHQQQQQNSRGRHVWRLTSGCGETGVLWIEDDDD